METFELAIRLAMVYWLGFNCIFGFSFMFITKLIIIYRAPSIRMSVSPVLIQQFKEFVCDESLTEAQIAKYVIWGNNNLEMSLNYYYTSKDSNKLKKEEPRNTASAWERLKDGAKKEK